MGTRGLSGFKYKNQYYLMYNQYDSYPESLGNAVIEFIKHVVKFNRIGTLKRNVSKLIKVNNDIIPTPEQIIKYTKYSNTGVSEQSLLDWYCLLYDLHGEKILYEILNGNVEHFDDSEDFGKNSLFCEYAYIMNLDSMEVDFYKGFQKSGQKSNHFGEKPYINTRSNGTKYISEYYPIKKVGSIEFLRIFYNSDNWIKEIYGDRE